MEQVAGHRNGDILTYSVPIGKNAEQNVEQIPALLLDRRKALPVASLKNVTAGGAILGPGNCCPGNCLTVPVDPHMF